MYQSQFLPFVCECYYHEANTVYEMEGKPSTSSLNICPETCCLGQMGEGVTTRKHPVSQLIHGHFMTTKYSPPRCFLYCYAIPNDMQDECQLQKVSKRGTGRVVVVLPILRGVKLLVQLVYWHLYTNRFSHSQTSIS
jgi:hypothetical protein